MNVINRRNSNRAKVDLLINRFLDGQPYMCRMTDISPTGLRLVPLLEPRHAPRFMGLQFQIPGSDTIFTASAETVDGSTGEGTGTGVRFTSLPADCESVIRRFVESN